MAGSGSLPHKVISGAFYHLARGYVRTKHPLVIAVGGSVGKTSTKLALAELLATEKNVSYMDDSYNNGLGLYLSVFNQKVPTNALSPLGWAKVLGRSLIKFAKAGPDILILEYGIDHPGDMDDMVNFIRPDIGFLTAVTPEHMEYMKTIDMVGEEEVKILSSAKQFGVVNSIDVEARFLGSLTTPIYHYGDASSEASLFLSHLFANLPVRPCLLKSSVFRQRASAVASRRFSQPRVVCAYSKVNKSRLLLTILLTSVQMLV